MYCTTQTNYQNNKGCNQCGSCLRYSICSKNHNIKYRTKSREFEYGTTSKGLVQNLKNKIINIQNESFKHRNNKKLSTKKQQKDYYCLMLRKISTLDRKLQHLEDLLLTHLDYETEQVISSRDSKTINCKYLNFHDSISSLLNLANKLKVEMVFRKHNMQGNNESSSEIYGKILALESELQDFSSYLEHLQRHGAKGQNLSKSFSQDMPKRFQNNGELNDEFTVGNELKSHDSGKNKNKETFVIKNKSPNNSQHGFKEVAPVNVNLVQTSTYGSPFDECQCLICSNLTYFNHQKDNDLKGNNLIKNPKNRNLKEESDCSCNLCNSDRKKKRLRKRNIYCDEYKVNENLSICSCSSCENREGKNNNFKRQNDVQLFHNTAGSHFWCECSENNKDCFHRTQRTNIRRGARAKPFYNAVEVSCLQPKPNRTNCNNTGSKNILRLRFENGLPVRTHSSMESTVDSFEEIINAKNVKQMQTNPAVIHHKYLKYKSQDSKSRRTAPKETLTNDIVYYEVTKGKANNVAKGINHKKIHDFNEGKTKQFTANSFQKRRTDHLAEQKDLRENRNSNVGNVKATHKQSEKFKRSSSKNYNSPHFKNNKLRIDENGSNSLDSGSDISTINESCYDGLQFFVCNRNSKLSYQVLQNTSHKIPNKKFHNGNSRNMFIKQNRENANENYYNTPEVFEDDFQDKSWQYHKKRRNNFHEKEPNSYNPEILGRKRSSYERKNNKNRKIGNIYESSETVQLKDVNYCKHDPTYKENQSNEDLTTELKEKNSSSSNESSSLRKFVDKLNEIENDVCDKCIIKEKKIKVPSHYIKQFNCKNGVKIIIKKEVIRCPDCTSKLDSNIFNLNDKNPKTELDQQLYSTSCNERAEETKVDHNTALKKNYTDETNIYIGSNNNRNLNDSSIVATKNNETQYLGNRGAVSIFQTNLDQDNIFTNPTVIQPTKLLGSQKSSTNISGSYRKGFDIVRKSSGKSNELTIEATAQFKNKSPISVEINKMETSMNGIVNTSYLCKLNDKETKYIIEENTKADNLPCLLTPPKTNGTLNKPNYTNGIQTNLHDRLYNDQSEIVYEMSLVNSQENIQSHSNKGNGEKKNNKFTPNKIQNQNEADSINLPTMKKNQKNQQEKDTTPDFGMDELEGNSTLNDMYKPKHKGKNRFKDFNNSLDKHIVNNRSPIKKISIAMRNNNFAALHNNTVGPKGYNYSNNVPHIQLLDTKNNRRTPFVNKYKNFDDISKCNCLSSSSTSKGSSFTVPSRCNLNVSKRVGLKKPIRPTFNVGRRSSKPLKYWHINYCRQPSRTINQINKPALDDTKLTQSPDVVPQYEFKDNSNEQFTTTVTSESSFSVVNWATIAQKLKEEKY